jgi:hypothetical protein
LKKPTLSKKQGSDGLVEKTNIGNLKRIKHLIVNSSVFNPHPPNRNYIAPLEFLKSTTGAFGFAKDYARLLVGLRYFAEAPTELVSRQSNQSNIVFGEVDVNGSFANRVVARKFSQDLEEVIQNSK